MQELEQLLEVMATLRDPERGCPWDREQTFESLVRHTLEEAYEVAETVAQGDLAELRDELGDLLFQVVFYARLAEEQGAFSFRDVAAGIVDKLVRRHPHVFGSEQVASSEEQTRIWEALKAGEREAKAAARGEQPSLLDGVSTALPALSRARKLQARAATVGFDWPAFGPVLEKLEEEVAELRAAHASPENHAAVEAELGDLLFTCVNLARHAGVDPESALRGANQRFSNRFRYLEARLAEQGSSPAEVDLAALDHLWEEAKEQGL